MHLNYVSSIPYSDYSSSLQYQATKKHTTNNISHSVYVTPTLIVSRIIKSALKLILDTLILQYNFVIKHNFNNQSLILHHSS